MAFNCATNVSKRCKYFNKLELRVREKRKGRRNIFRIKIFVTMLETLIIESFCHGI